LVTKLDINGGKVTFAAAAKQSGTRAENGSSPPIAQNLSCANFQKYRYAFQSHFTQSIGNFAVTKAK